MSNNTWNPAKAKNNVADTSSFNEDEYKRKYHLEEQVLAQEEANEAKAILQKAKKHYEKYTRFKRSIILKYVFFSVFFAIFIFCFVFLQKVQLENVTNLTTNILPKKLTDLNLTEPFTLYLLVASGIISFVVAFFISSSIRNRVWIEGKHHYWFRLFYGLVGLVCLLAFLFLAFSKLESILKTNYLQQLSKLNDKTLNDVVYVCLVIIYCTIGLFAIEYYGVCVFYTIKKCKILKINRENEAENRKQRQRI